MATPILRSHSAPRQRFRSDRLVYLDESGSEGNGWDIFRRAEFVPPVADGAIRAGAKVVWMQLGIVHEEAAEKARRAGMTVVMDACMLIEHRLRRSSLSK
ncbi:MAG: hypothetical protein DMG33_11405 [Acidobacteria bacterium]|nr:MAG: hypothetical protein DMG33_11405 [Acidobacteriota bacterium]